MWTALLGEVSPCPHGDAFGLADNDQSSQRPATSVVSAGCKLHNQISLFVPAANLSDPHFSPNLYSTGDPALRLPAMKFYRGPMQPRFVNSDDPEQLLGDPTMVNRKFESALNSVLVEGDYNPFEALGLPSPTIESEQMMTEKTIEKAHRNTMMLYHPDRAKSETQEERELAIVRMGHAQSARSSIIAALKWKSRGWFGALIIRYCGREPQEDVVSARSCNQRVDVQRAKIAEKLLQAQRTADAAANRAEREADIAARREQEERERAEAKAATAGLDAAAATRAEVAAAAVRRLRE